MTSDEAPLAMEQRHVCESEARMHSQEEVANRLESLDPKGAAQARELLLQFQSLLELSRQRLGQIEDEQRAGVRDERGYLHQSFRL